MTKSTGTTNLLLQAAVEALRPSNAAGSNATPPAAAVATQSDVRAGRISRPETPAREGPNPLVLSQILQRNTSVPRRLSSGSGSSGMGTPALMRSVSSLRGGLLDADSGNGGRPAFEVTVDQIRDQHFAAARESIQNQEILAALLEDLDYDCERLRSLLLAAQVRLFADSGR